MKRVTSFKAGLLGILLSVACADLVSAFSLTVLHNHDGEL